jgi:hypothetical protein
MAIMLSQRERYIAIGVGAAVALLALDYFVLSPYLAERDAIAQRQASVFQQLTSANDLFTLERRERRVWSAMQKSLSVDPSTAESQAEQAVLDWADTSGMSLTGLRPGKATTEGKFTVVSFSVTGTGSMPDLAHMLWSLESATVPLRVSDLQLKPRREGTDDLLAQFTLSVLCVPPSEASAMKQGGLP